MSAAEHDTTRRSFFLGGIGIALNAIAGILFAIPVIGYIASPMRRLSFLQWVALGPVDSFPENQTRLATYRNPFSRPWDGDTTKIPCWVRRVQGEEFQVVAINCTHLGCPVRWFEQSKLFMCPCHGGVFYADGRRASGPPPRGLFRYDFKVASGQLWIHAGELPTLGNRGHA